MCRRGSSLVSSGGVLEMRFRDGGLELWSSDVFSFAVTFGGSWTASILNNDTFLVFIDCSPFAVNKELIIFGCERIFLHVEWKKFIQIWFHYIQNRKIQVYSLWCNKNPPYYCYQKDIFFSAICQTNFFSY